MRVFGANVKREIIRAKSEKRQIGLCRCLVCLSKRIK